jgi:predicted metalloprotease
MKRLLVAAAALVALAVPVRASADITDPDELVNVVGATLNEFYSAQLQAIGHEYQPPSGIYWYTTRERTPCGPTEPDNAFYCSANGAIYLDRNLFDQLVRVADADYAAGAVLAHEWGHAVQDQLGILDWAIAKHYYKGVELQADCYTGVFSRYAEDKGLLEPGDLDEAARLMTAVGDQVRISPTTPGAHGTAPERVFWFQVGNKTNSLAECMTVYPTLYGGKTAPESRAAGTRG